MLDNRFWSKVSVGGPAECWEWRANKNNKGYGLFRPGGTAPKELVHRLSYENKNGPIPNGMVILHSCDNPACVNPAHLRTGTMKDNSVDAASKGRIAGMILGDALVIGLLRDYVAGASHAQLAKRYGISIKSVPDFTTGKSRKWLHGKHGCPTMKELKDARNSKPGAMITQEIADQIRRRLASGEMGKDLAIEFGLHKATVSDIKLRKIWR